MKTFSVAGTSKLNGVTKVRFANDFIGRIKTLSKNSHEDIELIELGSEMSKADACRVLLAHELFQSEEKQDAITDYVVRNCKEIKAELDNAGSEELEVEVELEENS